MPEGNGRRRGLASSVTTRPGPWWADAARRSSPWWETRQGRFSDYLPPDDLPPDSTPDAETVPPEGVPAGRFPMPAFVVAGAVLVVLLFLSHFTDQPRVSRVLVPVVGFLADDRVRARWLQPRHPDEPWLARLLILGVLVKIVGTILRYTTLLKKGQLGDASVYDEYGKRYAARGSERPASRCRRRARCARATSCAGSPASSTTCSAAT